MPTNHGSKVDIDALLHPARAFAHPMDVVRDEDLTLYEKRAILSSWASDACAVEDRATAGGDRRRLLVHPLGLLAERRGVHDLQPGGAPEREREDEHEEAEKEPDAAVGLLLRHLPARLTYPYCVGSW